MCGDIKIDPRVRLILVPLVGITTLFTTDKISIMILALGVGIMMFFSGVIKTTIGFLIVILGSCGLQFVLEGLKIPSLNILLVTILYILQRFMLFAMLGASISKTLRVGEIICTMEKLKIPRQIVIPFAVTLRFVPAIKREFGYIKDSMRIRGIECSFKEALFHPVKVMEYLLVPILMRSFKVADELSAAAMVRGIERHGEKTLIYEFDMNLLSSALIIVFAGFCLRTCLF